MRDSKGRLLPGSQLNPKGRPPGKKGPALYSRVLTPRTRRDTMHRNTLVFGRLVGFDEAGHSILWPSMKMRWICRESGVTYRYPLEEVVKEVMCDGCGKYHRLEVAPTQADLDTIDAMVKDWEDEDVLPE